MSPRQTPSVVVQYPQTKPTQEVFPMPHNPEGPGGLSSMDDFDLLSLGLLPQEEEPQEETSEEEPRINPLHDMDSLEFLLWAEEGARAQIARKKAQAQKREDSKP